MPDTLYPPLVHVIVTVEGADLDPVVAALEALGMAVGSVLPVIGIITGDAPQGVLDALRSVPGVIAVEEDRTVWTARP